MIDTLKKQEPEHPFIGPTAVRRDPPLETLQQHIVWDGGEWRVESNEVRHTQTSQEQTAVRISRSVEPLYSALVVPLARDGRLHFVSRYRYAIGSWSVEFPRFDLEGGDGGWRDAAELDLFRMTGLVAEKLLMLGAIHVEPALLATSAVVILAEGCRPAASTKRGKTAAAREAADAQDNLIGGLVELPQQEVSQLVLNGQLTCGLTLAALSLYRATLR